MADRTNAAKTLDDDGNLPKHPALDEPFKSPELDDMKPRLFDIARFVEPDGNLAMAFDAGDGIDDNLPRPLADSPWTDPKLVHEKCQFKMCIIRICTEGRARLAPYL